MTDLIGAAAGSVWQILEEKGQLSLAQLKRATGTDEKLLWLALGWLAREEKVSIARNKASYKINLTKLVD